jgi:hypothetical protein
MKGILLRIATGGAVVAVLLTIIALPASAAVPPPMAPLVSVANPNPGDYLRRGQNWVDGVACDPNASLTDATGGIAKVAVYLGDRDTAIGVPWYRPGGYFGSATISGTNQEFSANAAENSRLGIPSPDVSMCKQRNTAWRVLPSSFKKGIYDMNIYVQGKNGLETKVTIAGLRVDHP